MPNNNNLMPIEAKKPFQTVQEIKNEVPSFEEFMEGYESDNKVNYDDLTFSDISDKGKGYGPMPTLWRDFAPFLADSSSRANHWSYRALFRYSDGTIKNKLELRGINRMKEALRDIENGTIKVVREKQFSSSEYERSVVREMEVKEALRKKIESLENDYSYASERSDGTIAVMMENAFDLKQV